MEIKFIFQELGVKNGHTFTIKNVENSGDIEKSNKKEINTTIRLHKLLREKLINNQK